LPSASSTLLSVSWRMALAEHDEVLRRRVLSALAVGQDLLQQQPFYYASQIALLAQVQQLPTSAAKTRGTVNKK